MSPEVIERWAAELDYHRALPLLAWLNDEVVADASLHLTRTPARRHIGEARIVVHPADGQQGLGTKLLQERATIADDRGIEKLTLQAVVDREDAAIKAAQASAFVQARYCPVIRRTATAKGGT
jgi:GNAT superfamily N-acetyltransferase